MISFQTNRTSILLLFLVSLFLFSRSLQLHGLEFRDDEIFYFESTKQMVDKGDFLSPMYFDEHRFQKPILFYWLIILFYKIFGVNWVGVRMVSVVFSALTVSLTWYLARKMFNNKVALLSSGILMTTVMFFRHAKNAVPDGALNFFIVLSLTCVYQYYQALLVKEKEANFSFEFKRMSGIFFISCALGFMIKGFAALIVPIITLIIFTLCMKKPHMLKEFNFLKGTFIILTIVLPWFLYMIFRHGNSYIEYMLVDETKNRLLSTDSGNLVLTQINNFLKHGLFYLKTILSYFAPWSVFGLMAIPFSMLRLNKEGENRGPLVFLLIWIFVVFIFFSFMNFKINHYMLVLTTPFAILTAYLFLHENKNSTLIERIFNGFRKYLPIIIYVFGSAAFSFLALFLVGTHTGWGLIFLFTTIFVIFMMVKSQKRLTSPLILAIFLIVIFSQSSMMGKAKVTSHASLQGFADTINRYSLAESIIAVGSRDIHEKEFQVYFDDHQIIKVEGYNDQVTKEKLIDLFSGGNSVYCLITKNDFDKYIANDIGDQLIVLQEDYMFRKRMYIDKDFFKALVKLDQKTVYGYLLEKVILIRKKENA